MHLQSEEDGEPTEDELKSLCLKWECRVDMTIDNFVYWTLRKTKITKFDGDEERYKKSMPKLFRAIQREGMGKYERYQNANAEKDKRRLERNAKWRKNELRLIRYLDKLSAICSTWTHDDSSDDSDDESTYIQNDDNVSIKSIASSTNSSTETVINRYNSDIETESQNVCGSVLDNTAIKETVVETLDEVNTQSFVPKTTSTQN